MYHCVGGKCLTSTQGGHFYQYTGKKCSTRTQEGHLCHYTQGRKGTVPPQGSSCSNTQKGLLHHRTGKTPATVPKGELLTQPLKTTAALHTVVRGRGNYCITTQGLHRQLLIGGVVAVTLHWGTTVKPQSGWLVNQDKDETVSHYIRVAVGPLWSIIS